MAHIFEKKKHVREGNLTWSLLASPKQQVVANMAAKYLLKYRDTKRCFSTKGLLVLDFLDQLQADHEAADEAEVPVFDPSKLQLVDFLTLFTLKTIADEN